MIGLAKLVSVGLSGLSVTSLGAFFIPSLAELDSESTDLVYSEAEQEISDSKLVNFETKEAIVLKKLADLLEKFKTALQGIGTTTSKTHSEILTQFSKVKQEEVELQQSYEQNKSKLAELKKLVEDHYSINQRKLRNSAELQQTQFINKSLHSIGTTVDAWGKAIETILCEIHNSAGKTQCTNLNNWHKDDQYEKTTTLEVNLGGGAPTPHKAKAQNKL
ncbi:hypothetical protein [Candidatus Mycoplasma haematominutum]|uniref:Uncharacterized protein n=1 Tax=Candidatus Mycoplasma haematominutum 'Birmingham 1' TaxID=1116213 RepID=G8C3G6_9MOLU|nr:hypothetical protein [Candidatus Mycoplasma haematominutum]CCE66864.1 hypothetical protein MHM_03460 [Candidatus Mycoplasma haematominutum 'Birmingham 1']